jgi:hypothetical protein
MRQKSKIKSHKKKKRNPRGKNQSRCKIFTQGGGKYVYINIYEVVEE